ncbi:MAG: hypothetical protein CTY29_06685 [Methylobacter sp.]|nr:MAG: hypothetical protein CTY29_06685 [Methylobacter sp.]
MMEIKENTEPDKDMLRLQYKLSLSNIEFLDGYVPKSLALFVALNVGLVASAEKLGESKSVVAFIILVVGIFVVFLMRRVSFLAKCQKENMKKIEQFFQGTEHTSSIPHAWEDWLSTSNISQVTVVLLSILSCVALFK